MNVDSHGVAHSNSPRKFLSRRKLQVRVDVHRHTSHATCRTSPEPSLFGCLSSHDGPRIPFAPMSRPRVPSPKPGAHKLTPMSSVHRVAMGSDWWAFR